MKTQKKISKPRSSLLRRGTTILLAALMILSLLPAATIRSAALNWKTRYIEQAQALGIMSGNSYEDARPDDLVTRAEFVAMVNRAYGYTDMGPIPFEDVPEEKWYYDDICIGYNMGYFKGTSKDERTASPEDNLTREQAAVILARNMVLEERSGEVTEFSDGRDFSSWSRSIAEVISEEGIITGYEDDSFKPLKNITRAETAAMLSRAVGTPIQEEGVYSGNNYSGNVTITSDNVTLKDAIITGDLYISGGVDLGGVVLENVTVQGKIVVSGGGESELGQRSVILRNVTAEEMVVDSMINQFVTVKVDGLTEIPEANIRTHAYLEDVTEDGWGIARINLDGPSGATFQLAGNIKEAVNMTPNSTLHIAQGLAHSVTIDENAVGSNLNIERGAQVDDLNLDVGTQVTGGGDVKDLTVNAPGSSTTMLPDQVEIRPGIEANIAGETMNSETAAQSSDDPRLAAGYPKVKDVAPTSATGVFSTNKRGVVHWAISAMTDGSVTEDNLINPPAYGGNVLQNGRVDMAEAFTEQTVNITGLNRDGSYYLSAILVDSRGYRSAVKVAAFTTPDDTVPNFVDAYTNVVDVNDEQIAQAVVMANKDCRLYYVLLPEGSVAPTPNDFKTQSLSGSLGSGVLDVYKNEPTTISRINSVILDELTNYDLYLWLTDVDGAQSSQVKKLTVTTKDRTPPVIQQLLVKTVQTNAVTMTVTVDEPGTFYWAVVRQGATNFFTAANLELLASDINHDNPKIQIETGLNSLKNGAVTVRTAMTAVDFTISGLDPQTAYDLYFVVKDGGGNYNEYTGTYPDAMKTKAGNFDVPTVIHTLDNEGPTVNQDFTRPGGTGTTDIIIYPDSSISLIFSEHVQGMKDLNSDGVADGWVFLEEYEKADAAYRAGDDSAFSVFATTLQEYIQLRVKGSTDPVAVRDHDDDLEWVLDFSKVKVTRDPTGAGRLFVTFPYNPNPKQSAVNLEGGVSYNFFLQDISDTSENANPITYTDNYGLTMPTFTTISAQIHFEPANAKVPEDHDGLEDDGLTEKPDEEIWYFDYIFTADPVSHEAMSEDIYWDMVVWSTVSIQFNLFEKVGENGTWEKVGTGATTEATINTPYGELMGASVGMSLRNSDRDRALGKGNYGNPLREMEDDKQVMYAIGLTSLGDAGAARENWNTNVTLRITAMAGYTNFLDNAALLVGQERSYDEVMSESPNVSDITFPSPFTIDKPFTDNTHPNFTNDRPVIEPGSSGVNITVSTDRIGTRYYYVLAPVGIIDTKLDVDAEITDTVSGAVYKPGELLNENSWSVLPKSGAERSIQAAEPTNTYITTRPDNPVDGIRSGSQIYDGTAIPIYVDQLKPKTKYVAYFVLQGVSQLSYSPVYCFRFETGDVDTPIITLSEESPVVKVSVQVPAHVEWILMTPSMANSRVLGEDFYQYINVNDYGEEGEYKELENVTIDKKQADFKDLYQSLTQKTFTQYKQKEDGSGDALDANGNKIPTFTVLDALTTSIGGPNTMSVFDKFAGTTIYDAVYNLIGATSGTGYVDERGMIPSLYPQGTNVGAGDNVSPYEAKPQNMQIPTQYYFIAAAVNVMGTKYGFKAVAQVHMPDMDPPEVTSVSTVITKVYRAANPNTTYLTGFAMQNGTANFSYDITLTIVFDKTPYLLHVNDQNETVNEKLTTDLAYQYISTCPYRYGTNVTGQTVVIYLKGVPGSSIGVVNLFDNGTISNMYERTNGKKLSFTWGDMTYIPTEIQPELKWSWV